MIRFFDFFSRRDISVFSVFKYSHFFGYFIAVLSLQSICNSFSNVLVIHIIPTFDPVLMPFPPILEAPDALY